MVTGWPGAGAGNDWAGPTGGVSVMLPSEVVTVAWKPEPSWDARAVDSIPSSDREPTPLEASSR